MIRYEKDDAGYLKRNYENLLGEQKSDLDVLRTMRESMVGITMSSKKIDGIPGLRDEFNQIIMDLDEAIGIIENGVGRGAFPKGLSRGELEKRTLDALGKIGFDF